LLQAASQSFQTQLRDLKPAKCEQVCALKDDYIKNVKTLEGEWEKMHDHLSGMRSRQPEEKKEYKSGYQSDYWKIRVIPESLSAGGAEITFAKLIGLPIAKFHYNDNANSNPADLCSGKFVYNPPAGEFDAGTITVFRGDSIIKKFRGFMFSQKDAFKTKRDSLIQALAQHPKWPGTCGVVSNFDMNHDQLGMLDDLFPKIDEQEALTLLPGGRPWMRLYKSNKSNFEANDGLNPGFGGLYWSFCSSFHIAAADTEQILKGGCPCECFQSFFDNPKGKAFAKENLTVVNAMPGDFVWIPPGFSTYYHLRKA
jgi:hypothetical protein